jgi:hypothetical protein
MATLKSEKSQMADSSDKPMIGARQAAITAVSVTGTYATDDTPIETAINALIESND